MRPGSLTKECRLLVRPGRPTARLEGRNKSSASLPEGPNVALVPITRKPLPGRGRDALLELLAPELRDPLGAAPAASAAGAADAVATDAPSAAADEDVVGDTPLSAASPTNDASRGDEPTPQPKAPPPRNPLCSGDAKCIESTRSTEMVPPTLQAESLGDREPAVDKGDRAKGTSMTQCCVLPTALHWTSPQGPPTRPSGGHWAWL